VLKNFNVRPYTKSGLRHPLFEVSGNQPLSETIRAPLKATQYFCSSVMGSEDNVDAEEGSLTEALPYKYLRECFVGGSASRIIVQTEELVGFCKLNENIMPSIELYLSWLFVM
jgi:hypothetical protein